MSKTMSEIERIRMNRERRREEMHAAKMERDAQKRADDAEVHRAAMLLNRRIRTNKNAENNAPSGSVVGKQARYGPEFKRMIASFRSSLDLSVTHCEEDTVSNCTTQNTNHSMGRDSRLSVYVRKRPLTAEEVHARYFDVVTVLGDMSLALHEPKTKVDMSRTLDNHVFSFDGVFDESASSEDVFETIAKHRLQAVMSGGVFTCFAYGQTGSGKTYTMNSVISHAVRHLFEDASEGTGVPSAEGITLVVSYFEVYMSKIFDLLADRSELLLREDGYGAVQVVGLSERVARCAEDVMSIITDGQFLRRTTATHVNADSSRSHAVLQLSVRCHDSVAPGRICLVDLAGSERAADTVETDRQTRAEGAEINKSLLALKECIRALDNDKGHVPFRGSKLTQILRDSFVNPRSSTVVIATVSPSSTACEHTLNTLRYADRLKELAARQPAVAVLPSERAALVPGPFPSVHPRQRSASSTKRRVSVHGPTGKPALQRRNSLSSVSTGFSARARDHRYSFSHTPAIPVTPFDGSVTDTSRGDLTFGSASDSDSDQQLGEAVTSDTSFSKTLVGSSLTNVSRVRRQVSEVIAAATPSPHRKRHSSAVVRESPPVIAPAEFLVRAKAAFGTSQLDFVVDDRFLTSSVRSGAQVPSCNAVQSSGHPAGLSYGPKVSQQTVSFHPYTDRVPSQYQSLGYVQPVPFFLEGAPRPLVAVVSPSKSTSETVVMVSPSAARAIKLDVHIAENVTIPCVQPEAALVSFASVSPVAIEPTEGSRPPAGSSPPRTPRKSPSKPRRTPKKHEAVVIEDEATSLSHRKRREFACFWQEYSGVIHSTAGSDLGEAVAVKEEAMEESVQSVPLGIVRRRGKPDPHTVGVPAKQSLLLASEEASQPVIEAVNEAPLPIDPAEEAKPRRKHRSKRRQKTEADVAQVVDNSAQVAVQSEEIVQNADCSPRPPSPGRVLGRVRRSKAGTQGVPTEASNDSVRACSDDHDVVPVSEGVRLHDGARRSLRTPYGVLDPTVPGNGSRLVRKPVLEAQDVQPARVREEIATLEDVFGSTDAARAKPRRKKQSVGKQSSITQPDAQISVRPPEGPLPYYAAVQRPSLPVSRRHGSSREQVASVISETVSVLPLPGQLLCDPEIAATVPYRQMPRQSHEFPEVLSPTGRNPPVPSRADVRVRRQADSQPTTHQDKPRVSITGKRESEILASPLTPLVGLLNNGDPIAAGVVRQPTHTKEMPSVSAAAAMLEKQLEALKQQAVDVQKVLMARKLSRQKM